MIRFKLLAALLVLAVSASPALAEIKFAIGEPASESTRSGIGQISGWAVSDVEIVSVEALIDGASLGLVPYGGTRQDVAAQFPDFPDSEFSGWSMKWNYSLLAPGEHTVTIIVTDLLGGQLSKDVVFSTTAFKSQFIADPEQVHTMGAVITSPAEGRIIISGAEVGGEVVDIELLWDTASQQFLISNIIREETLVDNQAPKANAGPNRNVDAGKTVVVEGAAYDPDGHIVSYSWSQVSGSAVELINPDQAVVQFVAPTEAGTIRLRLDVMDDAGAHDEDDTSITVVVPVPNKPPVANAGFNFTMDTGETVNVTGSATDSDGTIVSWSWERVSGLAVTLQNANTNRVTFTGPGTAGTIVLRLTVTDDDGASGSDDVTVTVQNPPPPPNESPTANAGSDRTVQQGDAVTLTGSGSDPDGTIVSWSWQLISGTSVSISNANSQNASFTAPGTAGDIRFRLTVTDNNGGSDTDDVIITVEVNSDPPPPPPDNNTTGETVFSMLNNINAARGQERTCGGAVMLPAQPPFTWSDSLAAIAQLHSMDMARQGYFSHTSLDGTTMGNRVFPYWSGNRVGENIAASSANQSDSYVVNLWLNSPGHCELIMDPDFTHVGIGAGHDSDNGYTYHHFWTLDFGG